MVVVLVQNSGSKQTTCTNCASVLTYMPSETVQRKSYDYGGGCDLYYTITCPVCGQDTTVK